MFKLLVLRSHFYIYSLSWTTGLSTKWVKALYFKVDIIPQVV